MTQSSSLLNAHASNHLNWTEYSHTPNEEKFTMRITITRKRSANSKRPRENIERKKKRRRRTEFTFFVVAFFPAFQINSGWFCFLFFFFLLVLLLVLFSRSIGFVVDFSFAVAYTFYFCNFVCLFGRLVGREALSSINYLDC